MDHTGVGGGNFRRLLPCRLHVHVGPRPYGKYPGNITTCYNMYYMYHW